MATTLAQAFALKKQNPNLSTRDAISQVEGNTGTQKPAVTPTTPTPTSPVPPNSTLGQAQAIRDASGGTLRNAVAQVEGNVGTQNVPTNNPGINSAIRAGGEIQKQQYQQGMAQGMNSVDYTQKGVNGETFQVSPIDPTTGLSTPTQNVASTSPIDKTAEIQAKNQAQMEANAQKSQLAIQERKKAAEDAKLASIPTDQKGIVQSLISGVSVPAQNTAAYRNANTIYTQFKKYNSMTDTELLSNLKQGNIGSELDGYLQANPNYTLAKQKLAQEQKIASLNRIGQSVMNVAGGKEPVDLGDLTSVEAKYNPPVGVNEQAYLDHVTNNADVIRTGTELKKISTQISEASTAYNSALKDLQKQYSGKLSASALLTLMGSRTRDTKDLIDSLVNAKDLAKGDFDLAMKMAEGEYGAIQADIAQQQKLASEARQQQYARENAVFNANLLLQTNQAEFDQQIAQKAQAMGTPELAIPEVINQYAQLGIMASKSAQQHVADAKAFIARGGTLGQYISQMQKDFQAKPEYKAKFAPKATENFELKEVGGKTYRFNQATGEYEVISPITAGTGGDLRYLAGQFPNQAWAKNNNPAGITWNANFDKGTGTAKLFADAGIKFSKGTARPANEGGNYVTFATIEDGLKAQQIIMTQTYGNKTVGEMLSSWVGTSEGPNYAKQVAGMAGVDPSVKVSSLSPEQLSTLQMAKIKKESPGLYGILSQGTPQKEAKVLNDNDIALLGSVEKLDKQGKETLKENGYTEQDWANFKAGLLPPTSNQKKQASDVVKQIEDMLAGDALSDAVGMAKTPGAIPGTQRKDFEAKFATFRDSLALSNIDKLKGAMSDKDIEFLRNTASSLNLDMSEAEFIKQLNAVKQKYDNIAQGMPVNATQKTQTGAGTIDIAALKEKVKAKFLNR